MCRRSMNKFSVTLLAVGFLFTSISEGAFKYSKRRVHPGEYDQGPVKGSPLAKLFGEAPNYRAIAKYVLKTKGEKHRWIFGPMWYRGRTGNEQAKAFIVGQEGAQDENVTNRAFTGSTGTKTQKFLNHFGLKSEYLIMNTFVYTIFGQLDHNNARFKWYEQGADRGEVSPIVEYRHKLFDQMARQNKNTLQLILGVGSGGKASVATWVNSHSRGNPCSPRTVEVTLKNRKKVKLGLGNCDTSDLKRKFGLKHDLVVVGVPHPGGASPSNGGLSALKNIIRGFTSAAKVVADKMDDKDWADAWLKGTGVRLTTLKRRLRSEYKYGDAPIPFHDFAYGTNWRMGDRGTTSNRRGKVKHDGQRVGQDQLQVFSAAGKYNNKGHNLKYDRISDNKSGLQKAGSLIRVPGVSWLANSGMLGFDLPYEMPRFEKGNEKHVDLYDYGPCGLLRGAKSFGCSLSRALHDWPSNLNTLVRGVKSKNHESFGYGPIYRGRFKDAKLVVLADQYSHDDFFSTRALTGEVGQKLQRWLQVTGAGANYAILRSLPVDTLGMDKADIEKLATHDKVVEARNKIWTEIKKVASKNFVVVTLGSVAKEVAKSIPGVTAVAHLSSAGSASDWDSAAKKVADSSRALKKVGEYTGKLLAVARVDLPIHTRWWMGSTGTRAVRAEGDAKVQGNYYKVHAPKWVADLRPRDLTEAEEKAIDARIPQNLAGRSGKDDAKEQEFYHKDFNQDDIATQGFKQVASAQQDWEYIKDAKIQAQLHGDNAEEGQDYGLTEQEVDALLLKGRDGGGNIFDSVELDEDGDEDPGNTEQAETEQVGEPDQVQQN